MKILLLLCGHYRTFDRTVASWISALDGCDFDCRFVTFDKIDHNTKCWWHDNIAESASLTNEQINLLKSFDPNTEILTQVFSETELNDIYATLPLKVYMYKFKIIKNILESIDDKNYDMIIVSRFDVKINDIKFKNIQINLNEINIGARLAGNFFKGLAASDMLCAFHPANKNLFYNIPNDLIARNFSLPEECYTDFYYQNFIVVNHLWNWHDDFYIER
jgi:hypothetical protein